MMMMFLSARIQRQGLIQQLRQLLNQQYADSNARNPMLRSSLQGPGKAKSGVLDHLF
jgi:hypothetical protein